MPGRRGGIGPGRGGPGRGGPGPGGPRASRRRRRRRRTVLVGGMVGFGAYKMGKSQAEQIEQQSGVPLEEMSDEEVKSTADSMGIQLEEATPEDQAQMAADNPADAGATGATSGSDDYTAQLEQLADLHAKGILTDDEFEAKKAQLLGI